MTSLKNRLASVATVATIQTAKSMVQPFWAARREASFSTYTPQKNKYAKCKTANRAIGALIVNSQA